MNILITEIVWDTEGETTEECRLPDAIVILSFPPATADESTEENLGEVISEAFGFCHYGFKWEVYGKSHDTHAGGVFYPTNLALVDLTPA